jgi:hypothetical protein
MFLVCEGENGERMGVRRGEVRFGVFREWRGSKVGVEEGLE